VPLTTRKQFGQAELGRFAQAAGYMKADGTPDTDGWLAALQDMAQGLADTAKAATTPKGNPQIDEWGMVAHTRNYCGALRQLLQSAGL